MKVFTGRIEDDVHLRFNQVLFDRFWPKTDIWLGRDLEDLSGDRSDARFNLKLAISLHGLCQAGLDQAWHIIYTLRRRRAPACDERTQVRCCALIGAKNRDVGCVDRVQAIAKV